MGRTVDSFTGTSKVNTEVHDREVIYYNVSSLVKYRATHPSHNASKSEASWQIRKYVYDVNSLITDIDRLEGAVNSEAVINALDWEI